MRHGVERRAPRARAPAVRAPAPRAPSYPPAPRSAQLGDVNHMKCCGCFEGVKTDLSESKDGHIPISPGCGCDAATVRAIVDELQARKIGRGNVAQLRQQELHIAYTKDVNAKLDLIMTHLGLQAPPSNVDALVAGGGAAAPAAPPMLR